MVGSVKFVGQVSFIALTKQNNIKITWVNFCQRLLDEDNTLNPSELLLETNWGLLSFIEFENKIDECVKSGVNILNSLSYYKVYRIEK